MGFLVYSSCSCFYSHTYPGEVGTLELRIVLFKFQSSLTGQLMPLASQQHWVEFGGSQAYLSDKEVLHFNITRSPVWQKYWDNVVIARNLMYDSIGVGHGVSVSQAGMLRLANHSVNFSLYIFFKEMGVSIKFYILMLSSKGIEIVFQTEKINTIFCLNRDKRMVEPNKVIYNLIWHQNLCFDGWICGKINDEKIYA